MILVPVSLTGQTAAISATNLYVPPGNGIFRVVVYMMVTTAGTAGTLACTIRFTDNVGAQAPKPAADLALNATGSSPGSYIIRRNSGNITYETSMAGATGSPQYALYLRLEAL